MATTTIGAPGVTFPDGSVQASKGASGDVVLNVYTSPGTWTKPSTVKSIKVTVVGGGGNSGSATGSSVPSGLISSSSGSAGGGGCATRVYPASAIPGPQPYSVGGAATSSTFGGTVTVITGGAGGSSSPTGPGVRGTPAAGGAGSNGQLNIQGSAGGDAGVPTQGGSSQFAGTGSSQLYGGGAGGVYKSGPGTTPGNTGAQGVVIIEEFY